MDNIVLLWLTDHTYDLVGEHKSQVQQLDIVGWRFELMHRSSSNDRLKSRAIF